MSKIAAQDYLSPPDCPRCPRLAKFFNDPVPSFGSFDARLLIVGLAPALEGANKTGRPFTGDYPGELPYGALRRLGLASGDYKARPDDRPVRALCVRDGRGRNHARSSKFRLTGVEEYL